MKIDTDQADMAIGSFMFDNGRCSVTICLAMDWAPDYLFSKYPDRVAPVWNLVNLFTPLLWGLVFVSIILVFLFFQLSTFLYSKMGFRNSIVSEEIVLIPIRYF